MQSLPSKSLSSQTLVRGAELLRTQTMSLEHDSEYAEMAARRDELLVTWYSVTSDLEGCSYWGPESWLWKLQSSPLRSTWSI